MTAASGQALAEAQSYFLPEPGHGGGGDAYALAYGIRLSENSPYTTCAALADHVRFFKTCVKPFWLMPLTPRLFLWPQIMELVHPTIKSVQVPAEGEVADDLQRISSSTKQQQGFAVLQFARSGGVSEEQISAMLANVKTCLHLGFGQSVEVLLLPVVPLATGSGDAASASLLLTDIASPACQTWVASYVQNVSENGGVRC